MIIVIYIYIYIYKVITPLPLFFIIHEKILNVLPILEKITKKKYIKIITNIVVKYISKWYDNKYDRSSYTIFIVVQCGK